jgi:hypothetical protein
MKSFGHHPYSSRMYTTYNNFHAADTDDAADDEKEFIDAEK